MKMKTICLFLLVSLFLFRHVFAASFDGDWRGSVQRSDGQEMRIRIVISGNQATQYFRSEDGWSPASPEKTVMSQLKDMCLVAWLNQGGVWTENQVFSLSHINSSKLKVVWMRHVTNRQEGKPGEPWNKHGEGELMRAD